jgi:formylglycine-generating enzyme required for sulfatase activity
VTLARFALDRTEVTNANYRQCTNVGRCPLPDSPASAGQSTDFADPMYDLYPVVNVSWQAAGQFCAWLDKRLPSAEEWEVAASFSPATGRQYRYPWGDLYEAQMVNAGPATLARTQPVATFQPYGNSPSGLADMAGNVAEWTASSTDTGDDLKIVKGGSYLDDPEGVLVSAARLVAPEEAKPWLGFRCAADQPG